MRVAVLGVGKVGTAVARVAIEAGHEVRIAGSGPVSAYELIASVVSPGAEVLSAAEAVEDADLVVLSIPILKYRTLDPSALSGRIVIDAMNYWPLTDGDDPDFADPAVTSSERIAHHLRTSRVVKTLNHIGYHELESDRQPVGSPTRRALAVVSDDQEAAEIVAAFVSSVGYDAVVRGPLRLGRLLQPDTAIFVGSMTSAVLAGTLDGEAAAA